MGANPHPDKLYAYKRWYAVVLYRLLWFGLAFHAHRDLPYRLGVSTLLVILGMLAVMTFMLSFSFDDGVVGRRKTIFASADEALLRLPFTFTSVLIWGLFTLGIKHALVKKQRPVRMAGRMVLSDLAAASGTSNDR